jgi:hypothetical protein
MIEGRTVVGLEDDYLVGGDLGYCNDSEAVEFADIDEAESLHGLATGRGWSTWMPCGANAARLGAQVNDQSLVEAEWCLVVTRRQGHYDAVLSSGGQVRLCRYRGHLGP